MIPAGARLGPYEVVAPLGAGGMGEVYRARDGRLGREVALKVLPSGTAPDPERLRRFETEARAAGALNHPSILGILDVGSHEGRPYVVSELLEGETLRERLRVAPLPVKKAVELAILIAHGLEAAHEKGIVHRDLKPDNLFLTKDGRVKILDFGLAKLQAAVESESETVTSDAPVTQEGTVLGTVGYMSPEQVRGIVAGPRSDIFSLGAVLYEMVSGTRAFKRDTAAETMTAILKDDPPELSRVNPNAPDALERIIRRCLEKNPNERFQSARDVAYAIEVLSSTTPARSAVAGPEPPPAAAARRGRLPVARGLLAGGALVLLALLALVWRLLVAEPGAELSAYRFTPIATDAVYEGYPAWSPDGTTLAYVRDVNGVLQVFTRELSAPMAGQITQSPRDCQQPFWSPDGTRIFYVSQAGGEESLWSVSAAAGTPQVVLRNVVAATLSPDGKTLAVFREESGQGAFFQSLWISSPPGAEAVHYTVAPFSGRRFPEGTMRFSPDSSRLGLWISAVVDANAVSGGTSVEFWLLPMPAGTPRRVEVASDPTHPAAFTWLADGRRIVFASDQMAPTPGAHLWLADTERGGAPVALTATGGSETTPAASPDGRRLAFTAQEEDYRLIEIPLDGKPPRSAHLASRMETDPAWSPKGGQYAFVTERSGGPEVWLRSADGAFERPLVARESFKDGRSGLIASLAFSPDGQRLAYQRYSPAGRFGIWVSTVAGGAPVELPRMTDSTYLDFPTWSPDGTWLAFTYMQKGVWGLAKVKAGGGEAPVVIKEGIVYPSSPRWSPRGDFITCDTPDGFTLVAPDGKAARTLSDETWFAHGWSADGATLYAIRQTEDLHMQLTSFNVASGRERVVNADLGPTPPTTTPLRGFSLAPDGRSFLTSSVSVRGDIWLLEGFERRAGLVERLWPRAGARAADR